MIKIYNNFIKTTILLIIFVIFINNTESLLLYILNSLYLFKNIIIEIILKSLIFLLLEIISFITLNFIENILKHLQKSEINNEMMQKYEEEKQQNKNPSPGEDISQGMININKHYCEMEKSHIKTKEEQLEEVLQMHAATTAMNAMACTAGGGH